MSIIRSHRIEYDCECEACNGSGLYVGCGERDGFAVVCHHCKGTGCRHIVVTYKDFTGRKLRTDVSRVVRVNPGIILGVGATKRGEILTRESFGGLNYEDWFNGKPFVPGTEDRAHTCPAWFYQSADYDKRPKWDECGVCGTFSDCKEFKNKAACWARWDKEYKEPTP